ncbi:hypothetical protein FACS1894172_08710 [Spirochaetia bacterium]|nr:hypothetical protein FACS1894164_12370 [Spirochaetia bacterium]GHU32315.1 hypothetical protein FACS1894172_08710 [Spirochaetia bacterium]
MARIKEWVDHLTGKTTTYEGGTGYKISFPETVAEFFSLGLLNGMFYQTQEEVMQSATEIFTRALSECPEFATKAAIYGHTKNSLKLVPVIWLSYLSTLEDKSLFTKSFPRIVTNLNLLHDFMEICRKTPVRKGLGRSIKRAVNNQLFKLLNDYSVCRNKTTILELARVARPAFKQEHFQNYMRYVSRDELSFERARELKQALENIKQNKIDDDVLGAVEKYSFQLEELKHSINNFPASSKEKLHMLSQELIAEKDLEKVALLQQEIMELKQKEAGVLNNVDRQALYAILYKGLRYAALILNLVALERVFAVESRLVKKRRPTGGLFTQEEVLQSAVPPEIEAMVCTKIQSISDYRASNMLPFALINAQRMVTNKAFKKALGDILNTCAKETFNIPPETEILIGIDTSGSMSVSINDSLNAIDIATFFGALVKLAHPAASVCTIANTCTPVSFKSENLFDMAGEICKQASGGTYLETLMNEYAGQKYILLITDSVAADDLASKWLMAKKPASAKLIVWQLQAYQTHISNNPAVIYLAGFSNRLLSLIKAIIEDTGTQMAEIEKIKL